MNTEIMMFLKHFLAIEDGTNEKITNSKINSIVFNPKFHKSGIELLA